MALYNESPRVANHCVFNRVLFTTHTFRWNIAKRPVIAQSKSVPELSLIKVEAHFLKWITVNHAEAPFSAAKSNALDDFLGRVSLKLRSLSLATCSLSLRASCLTDLTSFSSGSSCDCETIFSTRRAVTLTDDEYSRQGLVHGLVIPRPP